MATCYQKSHGKVSAQSSYTPCSGSAGTQSCCANGDICLGQGVGLCYTPSGRTDFYIGGCTDQNFSDSSKCSGTCTNQNSNQVTYQTNATHPTWACCGLGSLGQQSCGSVTNETFSAPDPATLEATIHTATVLAWWLIVLIVAGAVLALAACCCCCWRCVLPRYRDRRSRGKFVPLASQGAYRGGGHDDGVWNAGIGGEQELMNHGQPYGHGGMGAAQGAPPQYSVAQFR